MKRKTKITDTKPSKQVTKTFEVPAATQRIDAVITKFRFGQAVKCAVCECGMSGIVVAKCLDINGRITVAVAAAKDLASIKDADWFEEKDLVAA